MMISVINFTASSSDTPLVLSVFFHPCTQVHESNYSNIGIMSFMLGFLQKEAISDIVVISQQPQTEHPNSNHAACGC